MYLLTKQKKIRDKKHKKPKKMIGSDKFKGRKEDNKLQKEK